MDIQGQLRRIDNITNDFKKEFGALSTEQLNWKPTPQSWSIAQNIDHIIVINESYYPIVKELRTGNYKTPWTGKLGFIVRWFGNLILKSVQPDRKKKIKTFPIWEPAQTQIGVDILERFERHQMTLMQLIGDSSDLIAAGKVISSPANKNIVYTLGTAFDILIAHEQRHFEQAKEVKHLRSKNL